MMKEKYKYIGIICIYLMHCVSISAQSDSLMHYLEVAAKNNPTVLQRYNEYQAALQKVPQVGSLPDPTLEMGVFLSPMELMSGNQVADIKLMQMFPWFGVLKNAKDEMSLMAKAKYQTFRDAKLQAQYDVQQTWFDLYKVRQNIRISEKNIDLLKTIERLSLVKFKYGSTGGSSSQIVIGSNLIGNAPSTSSANSAMNSMGGSSGSAATSSSISKSSGSMTISSGGVSLSEIYSIQIEMGDLENNIASLKTEEQVIVERFKSQLNRPHQPLNLKIEQLSTEHLGNEYLSVYDSIFRNNPMLEMLKYEQQSLVARKKMVSKMGLPMVGVGFNYSVISKSEMSTSAMNGQDMIMPMLTMTLPIYRQKYNAMKSETDFLELASEQNYKATVNALQTEYYEALQQYWEALRRMKLYDNQVILVNKSLDLLIKTFSSSGSGLAEILRVRQQLLNYEMKQVEALVDYNKAKALIKKLIIHN